MLDKERSVATIAIMRNGTTLQLPTTRCYDDGQQLTTLWQWPVAFYNLRCCGNGQQLVVLWQWPVTLYSLQCCGNGQQHVSVEKQIFIFYFYFTRLL